MFYCLQALKCSKLSNIEFLFVRRLVFSSWSHFSASSFRLRKQKKIFLSCLSLEVEETPAGNEVYPSLANTINVLNRLMQRDLFSLLQFLLMRLLYHPPSCSVILLFLFMCPLISLPDC